MALVLLPDFFAHRLYGLVAILSDYSYSLRAPVARSGLCQPFQAHDNMYDLMIFFGLLLD